MNLKTFGYAPAIIIPRIVALLVVVVFTRQIEPDQFGLYSLIIVYGEVLDSVLLDWSRLGILRFYSKYHGQALNSMLKDGFLLMLIFMTIGVGICYVISLSIEAESENSFFLLLGLYFFSYGSLRFCLNILRAQGRQTSYVIVEVVRPTFGFFVALALVGSFGPVYSWVAIGMFGVTGVFAVVLLPIILRNFLHAPHNREVFVEVIGYAAPLILVFVCTQLIIASDRYFINFFEGPFAVGIYAASFTLGMPVLAVLFNAINLGAFPMLVNAYEKGGDEDAQEVLRKVIAKLMFLCVPVLVGIFLLAVPFSEVLLAESYRINAPVIIRLIAIGSFLAGIKKFVFDQVFHLKRKSLMQGVTLAPAAIINVGLNFALIPVFGVIGAAWATVAGYGVAVVLSFFFSNRDIKILWPSRELMWIGVATLIMSIVVVLFRQDDSIKWLLVSIPSAIITYLMICWLGGVIHVINTTIHE